MLAAMLRLVVCLIALFAALSYGDEDAPRTEEEEVAARKARASGNSFAPVVGYEPVYSFVFGAAWG